MNVFVGCSVIVMLEILIFHSKNSIVNNKLKKKKIKKQQYKYLEIWGQILEDKTEKFQSSCLWGEVFRGRKGTVQVIINLEGLLRLFKPFTCTAAFWYLSLIGSGR